MAAKKQQGAVLPMDRVRQILRLKELGFNQRAIHRATGVARSSVQEYLRVAELHELTHEQAIALGDAELKSLLRKKTPGRIRKHAPADPDFVQVHAELTSRKGVTLELLWKEWNQSFGGGYSYSTFCRRYHEHAQKHSVVMRSEYEPGDKLLSDYAGETLSYWDFQGNQHTVEIFVAVLGMSNRTYAEATESQKLTHWVNSHIRAFSYFGGVTSAVVIDNLKSGVTKCHRYEPDINRTFEEFGTHYGTTIFPVRAAKPRDKAKVEKAVQEVERQLLAPLRHVRFSSIEEINSAISPLLEALNSRTMKDYGVSRNELFDKAEKAALKPLPALPFVVADWKRARVAIDYHIQVDYHYYSVPYYHVKKEVLIKSTEKLIEIFLNNERIASHARSSIPYRFSTLEAHMPPAHLAVKGWTADNFQRWATTVGAATELLVKAILTAPRYKEQSFRSILGIQRLERTHGKHLLEKAALIAVERRHHSQRAVRQILEVLAAKEVSVKPTDSSPVTHANLRGSSYYH